MPSRAAVRLGLVDAEVLAQALGIAPSTVRSRVRRGRLAPLACDVATRAALFALADALPPEPAREE